MPDPHATIALGDGIITVTIDRQEKHNAISRQVTETLWEAARALADRDDLRVMLITAVGRYFTAGIDLAASQETFDVSGRAAPDIAYRRSYREHHLLYDEFESIEKPIVLVAQGRCLGAGVEMAASCDFRLASTEASFALPEVQLGVIAGSGGTSRITRLVGPHWGKWLAMAGQEVDAERALMMGLVHEVFPPEALLSGATDFARRLIEIPTECLGLAKLAVDLSADVDRTSQRHIERIANTNLVSSEEFRRRTERFTQR